MLVLIFVRYRNTFLILKRAVSALSFPEMWETLSFSEEEYNASAAREYVIENLGIAETDISKVIHVHFIQKEQNVDDKKYFIVDLKNPFVELGHEYTAYEWIMPRQIGSYKSVPGLAEDIEKVKNY